jgi:hypothetical protein
MELKDFISATLLEILEGVKIAQEKAKNFGAIISPELGPQAQGALQSKGIQISNTLQVIEFVGLKIQIFNIGASATEKTINNNQAQHKIKFKVPLVYPRIGA